MRGAPYAVPTFYREIYASTAPRLFIRKAAQTFASQYLVHVALWCCATQAGQRGNSLYVFPAERQGGDFCRARIEPVIADSPLLAELVGSTDNTFMKAIGKGFLYLRGGQTDKGLITVDVDLACLDEVARYPAGTLEMIGPRLSSSYLGWQRAVSTPVFPSDQAGQLWERSTKRHYQVRCSHCSTWQQLEVDGNLNPETARVECGHCRGDMSYDRLGEGFWEADSPNGDWEGYQVNKLLSHRVDLPALAATYRQVLRGDVSQAGLQQFWNQDVGRSYLPKGGHLDADLLDACCSDVDFTALPSTGHDCVMGVDIGSVLHVVIMEPRHGLLYLVFAETVASFKDLGPLFYRYGVRRCVIDALPETHAARSFVADRALHGRAWLATYVELQSANKSMLCKWDDDTRTVQVNRTMAMDSVIHAMTIRRVVLPYPALAARELGGGVNQAGLGVLYRHLCAPVRVMALDAKGNQIARYDNNGADHFCFVAGTLIQTESGPVPIESVRPGMRVATRQGYGAVLASGRTHNCTSVYTCEWDNGASLTGTSSHPVHVPGRGFVPLGSLSIGEAASTWGEWKHASIAAASIGDIPTARAVPIESISLQTAQSGATGANGFMKKSGKTFMGLSRQVTSSIMQMATRSTMSLTILSACPAGSTNQTICAHVSPRKTPRVYALKWMLSAHFPLIGIALQKAGNGTAHMPKRLSDNSPSNGTSVVAAAFPSRDAVIPANDLHAIVQWPALPRSGALQAWTMNSGPAASAAPLSSSIVTHRNRPVLAPAPAALLVGRKPAGKAPVYNLTVEGAPEYFANGILVHNCHAMLYAFVAAEQAVGEMGVPESTERERDPDDRYAEMPALDAFYAQDEFARRDQIQYQRGTVRGGGFRTGSGRVIPPTPDTTRAEQDYSLPAPIGPRLPTPEDLPPLDFSHAFDDG